MKKTSEVLVLEYLLEVGQAVPRQVTSEVTQDPRVTRRVLRKMKGVGILKSESVLVDSGSGMMSTLTTLYSVDLSANALLKGEQV